MARNAKYFENAPFEFQRITRKAHSKSSEWEEIQDNKHTQTQEKEHIFGWQKPSFGKIKLNSDAAVWPNGRVGLGFIIRNHEGTVILAGKKDIQA